MNEPPAPPGMQRIAVGEPLPDWRSPKPEGGQFEINAHGAQLAVYYPTPTPGEVRGLRQGRARMGLLAFGEHSLFLLWKVDGLSQGWCDAPFALGLVHPDHRDIVPCKPSEGRMLVLILADNQDGTVHALRGTSLSPAFSALLDAQLARLRGNLPRFTAALHSDELRRAYARWPTPDEMLADALVTEVAGQPFPK